MKQFVKTLVAMLLIAMCLTSDTAATSAAPTSARLSNSVNVTSEESTKEGVTTFWDVAAEMGQGILEVCFALITSDIVRQFHRNLPGGDFDTLSTCRCQGNL